MKQMMISALALSIALAAGAAMARGNGEMGPRALPSFEELDQDNNGQVTLEDVQAFAEARHAAMEKKRAARQARMFEHVDVNNDGVVDAEEYTAFTDRVAERREQRGKRGWGRH